MNNRINFKEDGVGEDKRSTSVTQNLINDKEWSLRSSMVAQGFSLNSLVHDENVNLKSDVRQSGYLSSIFENASIVRDIVAI